MEATAKARFQKIAPRKARTIINLVRGKNVAVALNELKFTHKAAAPIVAKIIDSAIANARQKDETVDLDQLVISTAMVDQAPNWMMRRWRPRAMGRATMIKKGMSHITIVVSDGRDFDDEATSGAVTRARAEEGKA